MARTSRYPRVVGLRLGLGELAKLECLCQATDCPPSEVLRLPIRSAEVADFRPFRVVPKQDALALMAADQEVINAEDGA
jgi:hypothetical protein